MFMQVGDLKLDIEHRLLYLNGTGSASLRLDPMESRLLATLMESPGQVVSRAHLMRTVWQTDFLDDTRTLDVHICWLRRMALRVTAGKFRPLGRQGGLRVTAVKRTDTIA